MGSARLETMGAIKKLQAQVPDFHTLYVTGQAKIHVLFSKHHFYEQGTLPSTITHMLLIQTC